MLSFLSFAQRLRAGTACAATLLLAACGGGGGGGDAVPAPSSAFPRSASLANMCTADGEKAFVRSYLDEIYLWYDEIVAVNAADFPSARTYFNALLVRTPDSSGQPKDRFSAVLTTAGADALQAAALAPDELLAAIPSDSVPLTKTVTSAGGRKVGYVLFNDHNASAQDALISAFEDLRAAAVNDLVLDMRDNTGGFLYVAQTAASLVTSPASEGKVFEQIRFNNKRQAESEAATFRFSSRLQTPGSRYGVGHPLPQLGLPRLYVLSSNLTCSASESIINSLRGIDVEVVLVGGTTCGKPYGFRRKDNCGLAFFPIEFQGYNAKQFGDYATGFKATCQVAENASSPFGSTSEPLFAAALRHIDTGSCPAAASASDFDGLLSESLPAGTRVRGSMRPAWDGRLLQRPGQ